MTRLFPIDKYPHRVDLVFAPVALTGAGVLLWFLQTAYPICAQEKHAGNGTKIVQSLLIEDWQGLSDLSIDFDDETQRTISRFVKAHACLALNRNNWYSARGIHRIRTWCHCARDH